MSNDAGESGRIRCYAADRLAYVCAKAIMRGDIRTRSAIDDALLDYLEVGSPDGPRDVPTWIADYERVHFSGSNEVTRAYSAPEEDKPLMPPWESA